MTSEAEQQQGCTNEERSLSFIRRISPEVTLHHNTRSSKHCEVKRQIIPVRSASGDSHGMDEKDNRTSSEVPTMLPSFTTNPLSEALAETQAGAEMAHSTEASVGVRYHESEKGGVSSFVTRLLPGGNGVLLSRRTAETPIVPQAEATTVGPLANGDSAPGRATPGEAIKAKLARPVSAPAAKPAPDTPSPGYVSSSAPTAESQTIPTTTIATFFEQYKHPLSSTAPTSSPPESAPIDKSTSPSVPTVTATTNTTMSQVGVPAAPPPVTPPSPSKRFSLQHIIKRNEHKSTENRSNSHDPGSSKKILGKFNHHKREREVSPIHATHAEPQVDPTSAEAAAKKPSAVRKASLKLKSILN